MLMVRAGQVILWSAIAALGLCLVPRVPWELPLRLGYPLTAIDTMPVLFNDRYGYCEYYEAMRPAWEAGHIGPAFAAVPGRSGARFVKLGPVIIGVYPLGVLGNYAVGLGLSAIWLRLRCAARRPHCCQNCAYDLTGNVSGVCPECGQEVMAGGQNSA